MIARTDTQTLLNTVVAGIQERKGKEIVSLDFGTHDSAVCRYFVICHGDSNTHVAAIASGVQEFTSKTINVNVWHTEGHEHGQWIILDYIDVVVHVFQPHVRLYYDLEDLWADCPLIDYEQRSL